MSSRSYPANVQIQKFLEESYNKERDTRLAWFGNLVKGGEKGKSKQYEVFRRKIENAPKPAEGLLKKMSKDAVAPSYNKRIRKFDDTLASKVDSDFLLSAEMRPVTPQTKQKLYDGFTKEGKGRYQYLVNRNEKSPEEKFSFPLLSSWEYGWRLGDVIKKEEITKPKNGRTRIVADTFYTRTGIPAAP